MSYHNCFDKIYALFSNYMEYIEFEIQRENIFEMSNIENQQNIEKKIKKYNEKNLQKILKILNF